MDERFGVESLHPFKNRQAPGSILMDHAIWREGLFEDYHDLIEIEICLSRARVPENNKLLRCFQYIRTDAVSVGDYCWNGDCTNCQVWYEAEDGVVKSALACRLYVRPGMVITALSAHLRNDLSEDLGASGSLNPWV